MQNPLEGIGGLFQVRRDPGAIREAPGSRCLVGCSSCAYGAGGVYGRVRTVVWEGSAGERHPYPDQGDDVFGRG